MKTFRSWFSLIAVAVLFCALLSIPATYAQSVAPVQGDTQVSQLLTPETQNFVLNILTVLVAKYPWLATIIAVVGSMRLWAKPVFSALHALALLTPSKWDDGLWERLNTFFTDTAAGKFLAYLLDWFASIKVVPPTTPKAVVEKGGA